MAYFHLLCDSFVALLLIGIEEIALAPRNLIPSCGVELAGMKKEEIKIQVADDRVLSISGERNKEKVDQKDNFRRSERSFGKFYRQFKLPSNAKTQEISARVENGVLTVTVPKTEESKKKSEVRTVEITG